MTVRTGLTPVTGADWRSTQIGSIGFPGCSFARLHLPGKCPIHKPRKSTKNLINRLEHALACAVTLVRGSERRRPGSGKSACPRPFHVLLACPAFRSEKLKPTP